MKYSPNYDTLKREVWTDMKNLILLLGDENHTLTFEKDCVINLNYFGSSTPTALIEIQYRTNESGSEEIILTNDVIDDGVVREFDDILTLSLSEMLLVYYMMLKHTLA